MLSGGRQLIDRAAALCIALIGQGIFRGLSAGESYLRFADFFLGNGLTLVLTIHICKGYIGVGIDQPGSGERSQDISLGLDLKLNGRSVLGDVPDVPGQGLAVLTQGHPGRQGSHYVKILCIDHIGHHRIFSRRNRVNVGGPL